MLDYALSVFNLRHFVDAVSKAESDELSRTAEKFGKTAATLHDQPAEKRTWLLLEAIVNEQILYLSERQPDKYREY